MNMARFLSIFVDEKREIYTHFCEDESLLQKERGIMYDKIMMGQIIGRLRIQRNMSQEVLSGLADIQRSQLSAIESGHRLATPETLWRIADALGLRLSELIRLLEEQMDKQEEGRS